MIKDLLKGLLGGVGSLALACAAHAQQSPDLATGSIRAPTATPPAAPQSTTPSPSAGIASPSEAPTPGDATALGEIVVTAQKRSENLQRVPIAVTAISAAQLEKAGIANTFQLAAVTPGLNLSYNAGNLQPHLRGIGTTFNGPGVENPVALYIDGVYYASQLGALSDLENIQQISILKGPQGTLFGRNATGGVIQVSTRDPADHFEGAIKTSLDNFLTSRTNLYLGDAITDDIRGNISVSYVKQGKGWGDNLANGDEVHRIDHSISVRGKLLITPTDTTTIHLAADFTDRRDSLGPNIVPAPGTIQAIPGFVRTGNRWDIDLSDTPDNRFKGGGVSATIDQTVGGLGQLVSTTAYRRLDYTNNIVPVATPVRAETLFGDQPEHQFTEELQLVSPSGGPLTYAVGVYYYHEVARADPLSIQFFGPFLTPGGLQRIDITTKANTESLAGFGQATLRLLTGLNFTAGIRYTYEDRKFTGSEPSVLDGGIPIGSISPLYDEEKKFRRPTWRFALDYRVTSDILVYVSQNRGFKSGGFNGYDPTNPPYNPETLDAYEAGVKSELFGRRVRVNASAFHYDYRNIQVSRFTTTEIVYNGAAAKLDGFDLDFDARITSAFSLSGGMEYVDARFKRFPNAEFATVLPNGANILYSGDAGGNRVPYAAKWNANLAADYKLPTSSGVFDFNASANYNSGFYAEPNNILRQPSFTYLDGSIAWTAPNDRLTVTVFAHNLLNKAVFSLGQTHPTGFDVSYDNPPRTFGGSIAYKF